MAQGEFGDCVDIFDADGASATPGRMSACRAQPDQIGAHAVDAGGEATFGDLRQRCIVEGNAR
ncbi:hypothetical protein D3C78_1949490 [compost metagenome]